MAAAQSWDVVVVGGGIAGLTAANRSAQAGLRTVVLEQSEAEKYLCNSRFTGGTFHVCLNDVMTDSDKLGHVIEATTQGFARHDLAAAIAADAARGVRWLQQEGIRFIKASPAPHQAWVVAPPGRTRPGLDWEGRSGDVMLRTLEAKLMTRGGQVQRGERADELLMEDGRCIGVATRNGTHFTGRAVVLADGGFQGDLELVRAHITPAAEKLRQRGAGTGLGDGLRMATAVGAALIGLDRFYGHLLSIDALHNDQLWPYPYVDAVATAGIVVGRDGRRFADEGNGGVFLANAVARLDDPLSAVMIGDDTIWQGPGRQGLIPANPHLPHVGGTLHQADTLAQLATAAGLSAASLAETIAGYNAALQASTLGQLQPPRTASRYKPMPIVKPPFFAVPMCAGITNTMGGIAINGHGQVLTGDETPILGLYAVGATTGGLEGGPAVGYVGGLVKGVVFGIRAAEHIAADSRRG